MCTTKIVFLSDSSIELGLKRSLQVQPLTAVTRFIRQINMRLCPDGSDAIHQTNKYATVACDKTNSRDYILNYEQCHAGHLLP